MWCMTQSSHLLSFQHFEVRLPRGQKGLILLLSLLSHPILSCCCENETHTLTARMLVEEFLMPLCLHWWPFVTLVTVSAVVRCITDTVIQGITFVYSCTRIITKLHKLNHCLTWGTWPLIFHGRAPDSITLLSMCRTWHLFRDFVRIYNFPPASCLSAIVPYWSVIKLW